MNSIEECKMNSDLMSICRIETSKTKIGFQSNEFLNNTFTIEEIDNMTKEKLEIIEGKCIGSGYVIPQSVKIINRSDIYFPLESLNLTYSIDVEYKYTVCNPNPDSIITCKIETTNKIGALGKLDCDCSPLIIIIPSDLCDHNKLKELTSGSKVKVKIVGKKFEQNDRKITCIAEIYNES